MEGIIVDTSSILFALSRKVDVFRRVEEELNSRPVVSRGVVRELKSKAGSKKSSAAEAKVALKLIEKYGIRIEPDSGHVDDWILSSARRFEAVCTNDTGLRARLKGSGVTVYVVTTGGNFR